MSAARPEILKSCPCRVVIWVRLTRKVCFVKIRSYVLLYDVEEVQLKQLEKEISIVKRADEVLSVM